MKLKYLLIFLGFVCFTSIYAQKINSKAVRFFSKNLTYQPLIDDYLFIADAEISNKQYTEFLNWLLNNNQLETYNKMLPDTQVWFRKNISFQSFSSNYFQHPAFKDYPVVGISYLQAQAWCNWAVDRIMETEEFKKLNIEKIVLRLPTEAEWQKAARGTLPPTAIWPWEGNTIRMENGKKKDEGKYRLNVKVNGIVDINYNSESVFFTTPIYSYWPNTIGLYNICGNVSEWVQERKALGGSWNDSSNAARIDFKHSTLNDTFRSATIGFRPVLEIINNKKNDKTEPLGINTINNNKQVCYTNYGLFTPYFEMSNMLFDTFLTVSNYKECSINNTNCYKLTDCQYRQQDY